MTKKELAKVCNRTNATAINRTMGVLFGRTKGDLIPEEEKAIIQYFKNIDDSKITKEVNLDSYKKVYADIVKAGYMRRDELIERFEGHNMDNIYRAFDNAGLFTYDSTMKLPNSKGKLVKTSVIIPCDFS